MSEISELRRWSMWLCGACFYAYQFILRVSPAAIATDLMSSLAIDACTLGAVISYYYSGYALMQLPTGIIIDRISLRGPLGIACFLCAIGSLMFTFGTSTTVFATARTIMGIGSAFGFLSCVKVAAQNFSPQRLALFIQLSMALGTIGATLGGTPFAKVVSYVGWHEAYKVLSIVGLLLCAGIIISFRNSDTRCQKDMVQTARSESILTGIINIMQNPQTWIYGFYGFMMYVPLSGFIDLWAVPFMETTYHIDCTRASGVITTSYLGLAIGAPFWSSYVTKVQSYKKGLLWSAVVTGVCLTTVLIIPQINCLKDQAINLTYIFMALGGAGLAGQFIAFAGVTQLNVAHRTAMASGVQNMLCMSSGTIMMPFVGKILDSLAKSSPVTGELIYSSENYQIALIAIPISVFLAILSTYFIKEHYPIEEKLADELDLDLNYHAQT